MLRLARSRSLLTSTLMGYFRTRFARSPAFCEPEPKTIYTVPDSPENVQGSRRCLNMNLCAGKTRLLEIRCALLAARTQLCQTEAFSTRVASPHGRGA